MPGLVLDDTIPRDRPLDRLLLQKLSHSVKELSTLRTEAPHEYCHSLEEVVLNTRAFLEVCPFLSNTYTLMDEPQISLPSFPKPVIFEERQYNTSTEDKWPIVARNAGIEEQVCGFPARNSYT